MLIGGSGRIPFVILQWVACCGPTSANQHFNPVEYLQGDKPQSIRIWENHSLLPISSTIQAKKGVQSMGMFPSQVSDGTLSPKECFTEVQRPRPTKGGYLKGFQN